MSATADNTGQKINIQMLRTSFSLNRYALLAATRFPITTMNK